MDLETLRHCIRNGWIPDWVQAQQIEHALCEAEKHIAVQDAEIHDIALALDATQGELVYKATTELGRQVEDLALGHVNLETLAKNAAYIVQLERRIAALEAENKRLRERISNDIDIAAHSLFPRAVTQGDKEEERDANLIMERGIAALRGEVKHAEMVD